MKHFKNKYQIVATTIFIAYTLWWLLNQPHLKAQGTSVQLEASSFAVLALYGSIVGFKVARQWGGFKTVLGKALMFFSIGLLGQEIGQLIYDYMIYGLHQSALQYPSIGDVAFFGSVLMYIAGAFYISKVAGVHRSLKDTRARAIAIAVPVIILAVSGSILIFQHSYDTSHPLTVFLDIAYPVGQAVYISLAIAAYLISRKTLGGVIRRAILILIAALALQYLADFTFIYQSHHNTYVFGGYDDYFYLVSSFVMTTALIKFSTVYNNLGSKSDG